MMDTVIQIICAALGTLGFSLMFRVRPCHLPVATLGGALCWSCYLLVWQGSANVFLSTLTATALICIWSEAMARMRKAPANIFLIPGIIPLLPGGAMYYAMSGILYKDMDLFTKKGQEVAFVAVGIAAGIVVGSEIFRLYLSVRSRRRLVAEAKLQAQNHQEN